MSLSYKTVSCTFVPKKYLGMKVGVVWICNGTRF